jgi:multidrug resistance efflux pump
LIVVGLGAGSWLLVGHNGTDYSELLRHKVAYENLQLTVTERGALESAENAEIVCRVKARTQGSTVATTVRWLIDAGTEVQAGDKLIELDDSGLQDQLRTQKSTVDTAQAAWIQADEAYKIQLSQNVSDMATAQLKLDLARIAKQNYLEGEYAKTKRDIEGRLTMARSDLEMWEERASWSDRMSRPGRRYVTQAQAESDSARRTSASIALKNVEEELRVLEDATFGTKVQKLKQLQGDIDEAVRALERTKKQAVAKEVQADADRKGKLTVYELAVKAQEDIESEIRKCVLYAPHAGLVIYVVPDQMRFGQGSQQSMVAQGEPVREGQKLMRIPDLSKMVVNTKVHEAMVSKVRGDVIQPTGFSDGVKVGLWLNPDLMGRFLSQVYFADIRSAFSDQHKAAENRLVMNGQPATVRVDAFPTKTLKGHVKLVAAVASQPDWMSADVKLYQTYVSIDEPLPGLRPDMSAEVTVLTDLHHEHVLAVPLQAVVGSVDMGNKRKCFVMTGTGPQERMVTLGLSNDKMVEVQDGIAEGEEVILNPRMLMSDKEKAAAGTPKSADVPVEAKGGPGGEKGQGWPKGNGENGAYPGGPNGEKKGPFPGGNGEGKGMLPGAADKAGWPGKKGDGMPQARPDAQ